MSKLSNVTLAWLAQRLGTLDARALVVQCVGGEWIASVRTPAGIAVRVAAPTLESALDGMLDRLEIVKGKVLA